MQREEGKTSGIAELRQVLTEILPRGSESTVMSNRSSVESKDREMARDPFQAVSEGSGRQVQKANNTASQALPCGPREGQIGGCKVCYCPQSVSVES